MGCTDPIADMFTCIRNANMKLKDTLDVPASKEKEKILGILKDEGFILNFKKIEDDKQGILRIYMKYTSKKERVILGIKRVSSPGLRIYKGVDSLPKVRGGLGVVIMSTSNGVMTAKKAKSEKVGGEVLGYIW